ncbi:LamG-like jellyroll fold domain-containing protein [Kribbella sp. NPDC020789]
MSPGVLQKVLPAAKLSKSALFTYKARTIYPMPSGPALVSEWSAPCYFKVDMTPPPAPTIVARYKGAIVATCDTTPDTCPAVVPYGEKVDYTISSSSADTVAISYGFNGAWTRVTGRTVNVSFVTPSHTTMDFQARTHDSVGHTSSVAYHRLGIGPALPPVAVWNLDETSGGTAADDSGNNHPLTLTDTEWDDAGRVDGSLIFNGTSSRATAAASVVDTSQNFSISAWVRLTSKADSGAVTITGQNANGGQLRYWRAADRWTFIQTVSDDPAVAQDRVSSLDPPVLNAWTHLLGVFSASDKKMLLYVNGRLQGRTDITHTPWKATRAVEVGSYRVGTGIGVFPGSLDTVKIYQRVVEAPEARDLADPRTARAGKDETIAGLTASYAFDTIASSPDGVVTTPDAVYGSDLTVAGFAGADQSGAIVEDDERGKVLATSGNAAEGATINRPLVDTSASFTISAWVKLADVSQPRVLARQAGATNDAWRLEYRPQVGSDKVEWVFTLANGDTASAVTSQVVESMWAYQADRWVAIVALYDAAANRLTVKFGDRSKDGVMDTAVVPFSTGSTRVGGPPRSGPALPISGYIDDLRLYAGVVGQEQLCNDLGVDSGCL